MLRRKGRETSTGSKQDKQGKALTSCQAEAEAEAERCQQVE